VRWIHAHADKLGIDPRNLGIYGPSAGGGLVLAVALKLRDAGEKILKYMAPIYPMIDDRSDSPAYLRIPSIGVAKDTAAGLVSTWSATTIKSGFGSQCLADRTKLLGVVTTNAMVYEGTAPAFMDGSLNYKVGGMHLNPDGSVFQGSYDLVMRKGTAQCLYGFTDAPISATVTIVDAGKEERIQTSSLQELGSGTDKWLKLSARGFTFSSPTLKIKLNQEKPVTTQPTQPAQPSPQAGSSQSANSAPAVKAPAMRISITCVKGKLTRKVSGVAPKCPAGFKKK
jgi:hypothetical protein